MLLILLWLAQPLGGCWLKACSPAPALPGPLPRLALQGTWSSWRPPREGSWMRMMQPDASGTEQRRGCASVCCQEGRMAAARGPGLRRWREPSHLDSPAPRRRWALGHTGRVQGPGPLGESLRGESETSVSWSRPRVTCPAGQSPKATVHRGEMALAQARATCRTSGGGGAVPKEGAELVRDGRREAATAEISSCRRLSQTPASHAECPRHRCREQLSTRMCWLGPRGVITY